MDRRISVIIPNYNGGSTIGKCLGSAFSSEYNNFEVIVVDDCSTDNSVEIVKKFPCKLINLDKKSGASRARNTGAENSAGDILFFIDADCLLQKDTLSAVNKAFSKYSLPHPSLGKGGIVIGGTYTKIPYDNNFFSTFQSIFINYSETKREEPDYIAAHAMIIEPSAFKNSGGFPEDFLPIIEDVEFSHRLRRADIKLSMDSHILVQHIFNFTLMKSLKNAFRKSKYWIIYSLTNKDIFKDSGTASFELKANVTSFFAGLLLLSFFFLTNNYFALIFLVIMQVINIRIINRRLIKEFLDTKGLSFTFAAVLYYTLIYPLAVGAGALSGILKYLWSSYLSKIKFMYGLNAS